MELCYDDETDTCRVDGREYRPVKAEKPKDPTEGHSPLPWRMCNDNEYAFTDSNGRGVALRVCWGNKESNRALILRAVNHHAELLAFVDGLTAVSKEARELVAKVKGSP